jgi:predicted dehydrogenase
MEKQLKVGVVGTGVRGRHGLEMYLARVPGVKITKVSYYQDSDPVMLEGNGVPYAKSQAERYGAEYEEDWRNVINDPEIDIISVMVEPAKACKVILASVESGKHILCDKPPVKTAEQAEDVLKAVDKAGVRFTTFFSTRYEPLIRELKHKIDTGLIGRPLAAGMDFLMGNGPLEGFHMTANYVEAFGGGELVNFGCYAADCLNWILGEPKQVSAWGSPWFYDDYRAIGTDSLGVIAVNYENGAVGHITAGRIPSCNGVPVIRLQVTGEHGVIMADAASQQIRVSGKKQESMSFHEHIAYKMSEEFINLVRYHETAQNDLPGPLDALRAVRVLNGAYSSMNEGRSVSV